VAIRETSDEEYNQDGSYAYPPAPRSAEQHITFWESVPIPDTKLTATITAYKQMREQVGIEAAEEAVERWKVSNPDPTQFSTRAQKQGEKWSNDAGAVYDAAFAQAVAPLPETIYRTSVRPLVRAHQMRLYSRPLPQSERQKVLDYELLVDGQVLTVQQIEDLYQLSQIGNQII
jgi:hypothetical protein